MCPLSVVVPNCPAHILKAVNRLRGGELWTVEQISILLRRSNSRQPRQFLPPVLRFRPDSLKLGPGLRHQQHPHRRHFERHRLAVQVVSQNFPSASQA